MRLCILLLLTAALALGAAAQQPEEAPPQRAGPAAQPARGRQSEKFASVAPVPENPRLKLGHPLDPVDVATLTGKPQGPTYLTKAGPDGHSVYFSIPETWGNRWLADGPPPPVFFGETHRGRFFIPRHPARRFFFPVFNGMFFVFPR